MKGLGLTGLLLLIFSGLAHGENHGDENGQIKERQPYEFSYELDAYYSNAGVWFDLSGKPEPDGGALEETEVYQRLFNESLRPRVLLLEASVYPMPILGTWYKKNHPEQYEDFGLGPTDKSGKRRYNLLGSVTAGFQEPWAVSAFFGSAMKFHREGEDDKQSNRGYMGYLLSCGDQHIHNNVLIDDDWCEFEWKLKGDRIFHDETLSWSFRVGVKENGNPNIRDLVYVGLRRTNLNYSTAFLSFLNNANIDLMTEFAQGDMSLMRQEIIVGRNYPLSRWHMALALDVGVIYENPHKYTGPLNDPFAPSWTFVFRPNLKF
jgi:hypothetical protein